MSNKGKEYAIKFGRFLLRSCEIKFDEEGFLYWRYSGEEYDTQELYEYWFEFKYKP